MKRGLTGQYRIAKTACEPGRAFEPAPLPPEPPVELPPGHPHRLAARTHASFPTAARAVEALAGLGIVREVTGRRRERVFAYQRYLDILNEGTKAA